MVTGERCKNCGHPDYDHGGKCLWRKHGAVGACDCEKFISPVAEIVASLPLEEQRKLAVVNFLGIDHNHLIDVMLTKEHNNPTTFLVLCQVQVGNTPDKWVSDNLPKFREDWVVEYLASRRENIKQ